MILNNRLHEIDNLLVLKHAIVLNKIYNGNDQNAKWQAVHLDVPLNWLNLKLVLKGLFC